MLHVESEQHDTSDGTPETLRISRLKDGYIKIKMRERITEDGGSSIMADDKPDDDKSVVDSELGNNDSAGESATKEGAPDPNGDATSPTAKTKSPQAEGNSSQGAKSVADLTPKLVEQAIRSHVKKHMEEVGSSSDQVKFTNVRRALRAELGGISVSDFDKKVASSKAMKITQDQIVSQPSTY